MLNGHKLIIPAGAVTGATEFTLHELPTRMIRVRVQANGKDSLTFPEPESKHAKLVLYYEERCKNSNPSSDQIAQGSASVYRVKSDKPGDTVPLDTVPLSSSHERERREVRASLTRLSGYGLGAP
jgi:hypothetical protein